MLIAPPWLPLVPLGIVPSGGALSTEFVVRNVTLPLLAYAQALLVDHVSNLDLIKVP